MRRKAAALKPAARQWVYESMRALETHGATQLEALELLATALTETAYTVGQSIELDAVIAAWEAEDYRPIKVRKRGKSSKEGGR